MLTRQKVPLNRIRLDGTQARSRTHENYVATYAEMMREGTVFPPVVLYNDPVKPHWWWIGDGWHRVYAALRNGERDIDAVCRVGGKREALLCNIEENRKHRGIPLLKSDKINTARILLKDEKFSFWSNVRLAEMIGCSDNTVLKARNELESAGEKFPDKLQARTGEWLPRKKPAKNGCAPYAAQVRIDEAVAEAQRQVADEASMVTCPRCNGCGKIVPGKG